VTTTLVGVAEPPGEPGRQLRDPHAERAVLGAILLAGSLTSHLIAVLGEGDFTDPAYREVFAAAVAVAAQERRPDMAAVAGEVARRGGSSARMREVMTAAPPGATAVHYAAILRDLTALRHRDSAAAGEGLPDIPMRGFFTDDSP
jgi:replicative DNA helicase